MSTYSIDINNNKYDVDEKFYRDLSFAIDLLQKQLTKEKQLREEANIIWANKLNMKDKKLGEEIKDNIALRKQLKQKDALLLEACSLYNRMRLDQGMGNMSGDFLNRSEVKEVMK